MKLSNFKLDRIEGKSVLDKRLFATVDVTTGFLWWKKTENRPIVRSYGEFFRFKDTGEPTPGLQAEELRRRHEAKTGIIF